MDERDPVATLIERIVAGAQIPSRREQDDLRRELRSHFEECAGSPDAARAAIERFGPINAVSREFRRVYRAQYWAAYSLKVLACLAVSTASALLIELAVSLADHGGHLPPAAAFGHMAALGCALVSGLIAASESMRRPFNLWRAILAIAAYCGVSSAAIWWLPATASAFTTAAILVLLAVCCSNVTARAGRWLAAFGAFATAEYALHYALGVPFGPVRAMSASGILVTVAAWTGFILTRADRAFSLLVEAEP